MKRFYRVFSLLVLVLLILLTGTPSLPVRTASSQAASCEQVILTAYQVAEELCQKTGRNEACYGHISLDATSQPNVADFRFAEEGDIVNVADMQTLRLSAMNTVTNHWGIALLRFQANIANDQPNKNATLLLFGNVELENQFTKPSATMELTVTSDSNVNVRREPSTSTPIIGAVRAGQSVTVTGRLEDTSWLRVQIPNTQALGWINRTLVTDVEDSDLAELDVVDPGPQYGPMQAFYFNAGDEGDVCPEAPGSGILIQTPEGIAEITLLINEIDIQIGSTVYFRAAPDGDMTISVVEGMVYVEAFDQKVGIPAGSEATIPLNEEMKPAGPPTEPHGYNLDTMNLLPVQLLEREITIHPPLTDAEIDAVLHPPVENAAVEETPASSSGDAGNISIDNSSQVSEGTVPPQTEIAPPPPTEPAPTQETVVICHKGATTTIDPGSLEGHLGHGDTLGPCP